MKPKIAIDLFCGTGGFSHGWIEAGGHIAVAVDNWEEALKNHAHNHPSTPTLKLELGGDIEKTAETLRTYLEPFGDCHFHLHGSPPCQALSNASNANAEEGMVLVLWFLDLVEYMKPHSWSMENVTPLGRRLDALNVPYVRVNSADFGVPQLRKRVFAGQGWTIEKTHSKEKWVSVIEAIPDLIDKEFEAVPSMVDRWSNLTVERPCPTITSQSQGQIRIKCLKTFKINPISVKEASIIQGWGDLSFYDGLLMLEKRVMVGNMICPPIAKAICEGIQ